jgi:hypothetical protein
MYASTMLDKRWLVLLFLWINVAVASPEEFHLKTPVNRLPVPIDFNEPVYIETTQTAEVSFTSEFDKDSPDLRKRYSVVDVNPHDNKVSLVIKCDWLHRTAKVTVTFTVNNEPQEIMDEYKIISYDPKNVCLLLTTPSGAVQVIMMNADIGSFVQSISQAGMLLNGTSMWYGFCRN